jgi:hypothetical protein
MSVGLTRFTTLPAMYKIVGDKSDTKNAAVHGSNGPILLGAEIGGRCLRRTGDGTVYGACAESNSESNCMLRNPRPLCLHACFLALLYHIIRSPD